MKKIYFSILVCLLGSSVAAQDPTPDATFDFDGYRATRRDCTDYNSGDAICVQVDGKILTAGMSGPQSTIARVVRYHTDGTTDFSYGVNGVAQIDISESTGSGSCMVSDMALQSDGKVVITGQGRIPGGTAIVVARFDTMGFPDSTFNNIGLLFKEVFVGETANGQAIGIQSNGKIVVTGYAFDGNHTQMHIHRFNTDGTDDVTFDGDGKVVMSNSMYATTGYGMTIQPDGKIVVVGRRTFTSINVVVWRFNTNGSPDGNFDNDGVAYYDFGFTEEMSAVAVQPDGKLVIGGFKGFPMDFLVMRVDASGVLDSSFSNDAYITIDFAGYDDWLAGLSIQPDGKILCVGQGGNGNAQMARLYTNGDYDPNFDFDGKYAAAFEGTASFLGHTFQQDGKLLVCGWTNDSPVSYLLVARYKIDYEVGIPENTRDEFTVTPNPFTSSFVIQRSNYDNDAVLNLYNAAGTLVRSETVRGPSAVVDRRDLAAGIYVAELVEENGNASRVMIVASNEY